MRKRNRKPHRPHKSPRLVEAMKAAGLDAAGLMAASGYPTAQINRYLTGQVRLGAKIAAVLGPALGVSFGWLMGVDDTGGPAVPAAVEGDAASVERKSDEASAAA